MPILATGPCPVLRKTPCERAYNSFRDKDKSEEQKKFLKLVDAIQRNEIELNKQMFNLQKMMDFQKKQLVVVNKFYMRCSDIAERELSKDRKDG